MSGGIDEERGDGCTCCTDEPTGTPSEAARDRREDFATRVKGDRYALRRTKRLTAHSQGFLQWAGRRFAALNVPLEKPQVDGSVSIEELSGPRCELLCNALCGDPACYAQLSGCAHTDAAGATLSSWVPTPTLGTNTATTPVVHGTGAAGPLVAREDSSTNPVALLGLAAALTSASLHSPTLTVFPDASVAAPAYRGASWRCEGAETEPVWKSLTGQMSQHYATEAARKRQKRDSSPYSEHLVEELVAKSIERSPLHAWYAALAPRSNRRHQTFNFLQEVAIVEHAHFLERMLSDATQRRGGSINSGCGPFPIADAVIDFGGGNGMMAFAAGHRLQMRHIVVDRYVPGFRTDNTCAAEDPYFFRVHKDIEAIDWKADIGHPASRCIAVSKHLCGSGIDHVLRMFDREAAWPLALALSSCCHHKCRLEEYVHGAYLRALGIETQQHFDDVARRCGWLASEHPAWMQRVGATAEALLDLGRVLWLRQRGYAAFTVTCMSTFLSPRNRMLVAWKSAGLIGP